MRAIPRVSMVWSLAAAAALFATSCGESGSPTVTLTTPSATGLVTAPTPESPSDDLQLDTLRPTLRIANATSSVGTRTYEFQVADNASFTASPGAQSYALFAVRTGVTEGTDGKTSITLDVDLQPATRFYWRARAFLAGAPGPWSTTSRFRTKVQAFINGTSVYDPLTDGRTVGEAVNVLFIGTGDPFPGAKLVDANSYLSYGLGAPLTEGEISFNASRIKPGDSSFDNQFRMVTMQDGTGSLASNPWRVLVDKLSPNNGNRARLEFFVNGVSSGAASSTTQVWTDFKTYFVRLEWRGGTARWRIYDGSDASAPVKVDLTATYTGTYSPPSHIITIGARDGQSMRDLRASNVYVSSVPRPSSLGTALER